MVSINQKRAIIKNILTGDFDASTKDILSIDITEATKIRGDRDNDSKVIFDIDIHLVDDKEKHEAKILYLNGKEETGHYTLNELDEMYLRCVDVPVIIDLVNNETGQS